MSEQLRLELDLRHYCGSCPLESICALRELLPCQPRFGDPGYGGPNVLHPARPDLDDYLADLGGAGLDDVEVLPEARPELPLVTPRVRARRALRGQLDRPFYAVGPDQVIAHRRSVLAADDLREILDLRADQRIVLTLFGTDPLMELLWARRGSIVPQIAEAGYDLVAPPSFSARINHPPAEFLYNLKRSLAFFSILQWAGVPSVPRLAWLCEADVDRVARWCNSRAHLTDVSLDLAVKQPEEWRRQVALLGRFDFVTGGRFRFLVHGPAAAARMDDLFSILGARLHLTGSRAISRPRSGAADYRRLVDEEVAAATLALERHVGHPGDRTTPGAADPVPEATHLPLAA